MTITRQPPNYLLLGVGAGLVIILTVTFILTWADSLLSALLAAVGAGTGVLLVVLEVRRIRRTKGESRNRHEQA
ncbi:MAG: hypothetical protein ACTHZ5_00250 [Micrococcaceae bacterium]